jgi:hypothetical protein
MKTFPHSVIKQLIFVCTNSREKGERISCAGEGRCGKEVLEQLKDYVSKHNLKKVVRGWRNPAAKNSANKAPAVAIMPDNVYLGDVSPADCRSDHRDLPEAAPAGLVFTSPRIYRAIF